MAKKFHPDTDIVYTTREINEYMVCGRMIPFGPDYAPYQHSGSVEIMEAAWTNDGTAPSHIKLYNHWSSGSISGGYYQTIFGKNHTDINVGNSILDITYGASISSSFCQAGCINVAEKIRIYRKFAKELLGDPNKIFNINNASVHELIFLTIKRSQFKDKIKPGTVKLNTMFTGSVESHLDIANIKEERTFTDSLVVNPPGSADLNKIFYGLFGVRKGPLYEVVDTVAGERGVLKHAASSGSIYSVVSSSDVGHVYYDKGILALIPHLISATGANATDPGNYWFTSGAGATTYEYGQLATGSVSPNRWFDDLITGCRQRIIGLEFGSSIFMRSTFYICQADKSEFNYSSNPSFVKNGRIITTSGAAESLGSRAFITKVGLLGENNELIAVASFRKPVKKTPDTELLIKVRLDY